VFRITRRNRYNRYLANGFTPYEAFEFSKVAYRRAKALKLMVRERRDLLIPLRHQADQLGWGRAKYEREKRDLIAYDYRDKGLTYDPHNRKDAWRLFRYYEDQVDDGYNARYFKRKRPKDGIKINKGIVQAQKARWREKQRNKKAMGYK